MRLSIRSGLLAALLVFLLSGGRPCSSEDLAPSSVIIAYVFPRDRPIDPADIAAGKLTHINYAFLNVSDGEVVQGSINDTANLKALTGMRSGHPHLKILASVGGWIWSGNFSDAALTQESRKRFAKSALDFVKRHDLDGIDIDWEYPGLPGAGNTYRAEDKENFTLLLAEIRAALDDGGAPTRRHYLLTLAAGANAKYLDHVEMDKIPAHVDFVNLMTYDFRESEDRLAGHHANLLPNPADDKNLSVQGAVDRFLAAKAPPSKIVLGVPFYGHGWSEVPEKDHGLYQPAKPLEGMELHYGTIAGLIGHDGWTRFWDETSQAPYLWNAGKRLFVSYDDPESLRLKCRFVRSQGLAGVMFWEYYADKTGSLLTTLSTELGVHD